MSRHSSKVRSQRGQHNAQTCAPIPDSSAAHAHPSACRQLPRAQLPCSASLAWTGNPILSPAALQDGCPSCLLLHKGALAHPKRKGFPLNQTHWSTRCRASDAFVLCAGPLQPSPAPCSAELGIDLRGIFSKTRAILLHRLNNKATEELDMGGALVFVLLLGGLHLLVSRAVYARGLAAGSLNCQLMALTPKALRCP